MKWLFMTLTFCSSVILVFLRAFFNNKMFDHLSFFAMALFLAYYMILTLKTFVCFKGMFDI